MDIDFKAFTIHDSFHSYSQRLNILNVISRYATFVRSHARSAGTSRAPSKVAVKRDVSQLVSGSKVQFTDNAGELYSVNRRMYLFRGLDRHKHGHVACMNINEDGLCQF